MAITHRIDAAKKEPISGAEKKAVLMEMLPKIQKVFPGARVVDGYSKDVSHARGVDYVLVVKRPEYSFDGEFTAYVKKGLRTLKLDGYLMNPSNGVVDVVIK